MSENPVPYPLFRGATRVPLYFGMPVIPGLMALSGIGAIALLSHRLWVWGFLIPILLAMRIIVKYDDRAFRIWGLWLDTKARNFRHRRFWQASSYTPVSYSKSKGRFGRRR